MNFGHTIDFIIYYKINDYRYYENIVLGMIYAMVQCNIIDIK